MRIQWASYGSNQRAPEWMRVDERPGCTSAGIFLPTCTYTQAKICTGKNGTAKPSPSTVIDPFITALSPITRQPQQQ